MIERDIDISTADGVMNTRLCHPDEGGPFPFVLFMMDAPGIRPELYDMASRLASVGYAVLLPNLYYRTDRVVAFPPEQVTLDGGVLRTRMSAMAAALSDEMVMADAAAALAFAARQEAISDGPAGVIGHCMGGRFAFRTAARFSDRFAACASIYGTKLVQDGPHSPHLDAERARGELYFAFGGADPYIPGDKVDQLRAHLAGLAVMARVEVFAGSGHGFMFQRGHYHRDSTESVWSRVFSLFQRRLR
jgi:carboxymethylenebutenolidase